MLLFVLCFVSCIAFACGKSAWASSDNGFGGGVTFGEDLCRQYTTCDMCLEDPKCGWCKDYRLCVIGNSTGPGEGTCEWYYYNCPNPTTTVFHTTLFPPNNNSYSWYTYGGDYQHSGFVSYYNEKIVSSSKANVFLTIDNNDMASSSLSSSSYYQSSVAIVGNVLYLNDFNPSSESMNINAYSLAEKKLLWTVTPQGGDFTYNYATGPSVTPNNEYVLLLAGSTYQGLIAPISVNVDTTVAKGINYGFYYKAYNMVWSVIAPAIDEYSQYLYFMGTNGDEDSFAEIFNIASLSKEYEAGFSGHNTISFQPAYFNDSAYYHIGDTIWKVNDVNGYSSLYQSSKISYNGENLNSTIAISSDNNILFVSGYYLCAIDLTKSSSNNGNQLWCNKMNGGSTQGVTPAIDKSNVYIYDNGYIRAYDQRSGQSVYSYGSGKLKNECNLSYGCLSSQPILTRHNVIWADGTNVFIYDKSQENKVLAINNVCGQSWDGFGNSIAFYDKYLAVSCKDKMVMYKIVV